MALRHVQALFAAVRSNPRHPMNQAGRLMGRHCRARLQRAQAKRIKAGKRPFNPAGPAAYAGLV